MKCKEMPSQEYLAQLFRYEDGSLIYVRSPHPRKQLIGTVAGCKNGNGYMQVCIDGVVWLQHRIIWKLLKGETPESLDHRDGDAANNHIENLRGATHAQNQHNTKRIRISASGERNIRVQPNGRFRAQVGLNKRQIHIGVFDSKDEAVAAVIAARAKYHGEFSIDARQQIQG